MKLDIDNPSIGGDEVNDPDLDAELLFARQEMGAFLSGRGITKWEWRSPDNVLRDVNMSLKSYLRGKAEPPVKVDTGWAFALPDTIPESTFGAIESLPDEVVTPFMLVAQNALQYMKTLIPARVLSGLAARPAVMNHSERAKIRRAAAAVESPVDVLASPEFISQDAVEAIKAVYPALYKKVVEIVGEVIAGLSRPLRSREQVALSRLIGAPLYQNAALVGKDATQEGAGKTPRGKPPAEPELQTTTQKLAGT